MTATSRAPCCLLCWAAAELVLTCTVSRAPQDPNVHVAEPDGAAPAVTYADRYDMDTQEFPTVPAVEPPYVVDE